MKYTHYEFAKAARFVALLAEEEKSGQLRRIVDQINWAGSMLYMTPGTTDYKERFVYEYIQLEERTRRLGNMLDNWEKLDFDPKCPRELLAEQLAAMMDYKMLLEKRAKVEGIDLPYGALTWHGVGG